MSIPKNVSDEYTGRLVTHIECVREAGAMIGVDRDLLAVHDASKWETVEFEGYALHFCGGGAPEQFALAWLHHIHHNPHHWQHWIFSDGYAPKGSNAENGVVRMPDRYALEMIADWMGASKAYTGSWDMTEWLGKNIPKIRLHSQTAKLVREVLDHQGYADTVFLYRFAHEGAEKLRE